MTYLRRRTQTDPNNPRTYGEVLWRPVDRRENYVKRCVGLPGDTLQIVDGQVMIDGKAIQNPENLQFNYFVQTTGPYIPEEMFMNWESAMLTGH